MKKARPTRAIRVSTKGASRRNSVAPHAVEVPLRNGATVVLTADLGPAETSVEEVETYLSRARTWFELEFDQLELFETNIASVAHRKMASFAELTTTPDWIAPVKIEMRYVAPTTRRGSSHRGASAIAAGAASSTALSATDAASSIVSPAIVGDTYILPATLSRRTIASAISGAQERGEDWDSAIKGGTLTERDRETLEIALRAWKEVDQDTLDVLVNNLLENGLNERGWAFASYDGILDARERQKKTKVEGGKRYKAGHRLEDRDEVHKSVHRLANLFADVYPTEEQRRRRRGRAAPVIAIQELEYDLVSGAATGVWYALGSWADTVRDEGILTSRKILAYHPGRQGVEKRLGRHLVALLEASQHPDGIAARRIAEIYDELHLTVEEANPGRTQSRFERALAQLQDDGIIGPWRYEPDLRKRPLPSRGFLADWLSRELIVRPATASRITLTAKLTR